MKKILVLGDYTAAPYHPLGGVDTALVDLLSTTADVTCTDDYNAMADLSAYDLFICSAILTAGNAQIASPMHRRRGW